MKPLQIVTLSKWSHQTGKGGKLMSQNKNNYFD